MDGAMDPGQRRWLAQEGRGPQNEGPRSLGCDSLGIVPGIDPVLPDPARSHPLSGWRQTSTVRMRVGLLGVRVRVRVRIRVRVIYNFFNKIN